MCFVETHETLLSHAGMALLHNCRSHVHCQAAPQPLPSVHLLYTLHVALSPLGCVRELRGWVALFVHIWQQTNKTSLQLGSRESGRGQSCVIRHIQLLPGAETREMLPLTLTASTLSLLEPRLQQYSVTDNLG